MNLVINCMQCFNELGHPTEEYRLVEMNNNGLLSSTCSRGHTTITMLQQQKFEILFQIASMALLDGYPREAITSTAAALERFYEFFINIICIKNNSNLDDFEDLWKHVENQSERQFGAYLFIYYFDKKGSLPPIIDDKKPSISGISKNKTKKWKEFRNNVVHKGYIPSSNEAFSYMELVFNYINTLVDDIKENYSDEILKSVFNYQLKRTKNSDNSTPISSMSIPTIISLNRTNKVSFSESLEALKKYRVNLHPK